MEQDLLGWLNSQPAWMREATNIFIKQGGIEDNQINTLADICEQEVKGDDCSQYIVEQSNLLSLNVGEAFAIEKISEIEGVNAISSNKPIQFSNSGINVVYGSNGAGKSGYIRILKMVSGATYREDIKGNIYQSKRAKPKCKIDISKDKESEQLDCDLMKAGEHEVLRKIDIFDTKTAQGYIGDEKEAAFEPWIFEMFSVLGEVAVKIKEELTKRKANIILDKYEVPIEFTETENIKALDEITYKTKVSDVVREFTEQDQSMLEELKQKSQVEKNKLVIELKQKNINELTEVVNYFKLFEHFYSKTNLETIEILAVDWNEKKAACKLAEDLLEQNIDELDRKNKNDSQWLLLWKIARKFFDATKSESDENFVNVGGQCPLCHQYIQEKHTLRMRTIDDYVSGEVARAKDEAKEKYIEALVYPKVKRIEELCVRLGDYKEELEEEIRRVNEIFEKTSCDIDHIKEEPIKITFVDLSKEIKPIETIIEKLQSEQESLIKINTAEDQKLIQSTIRNLEEKKIISQNEKNITENISKLGDIHLMDEAIRKTATNKITAKSKELAKSLITDAYIKRFNDELKKLSPSGLIAQVIEGKGRKGKIPYKVQLCDADGNYVSPKDILSEGESRAVALAAFFAEASGREEKCPLIVDDPISSLDYEYEKRVIARLVESAQYRQVIVFTHRISVVVGINEEVNHYQNIRFTELSLKATKDRKGIPGEPDVNAGKADKLLNRLINDSLSKLKKMDELDEDFNRERHYLCQQFRNCVEKSIEDFLIGEVVVRFRKDIQTRRIKYLSSITKSDCDIVDDMMTKYSAYDHSMSTETPLIEFSMQEIETDMQKFSEWIKDRKKILSNQ